MPVAGLLVLSSDETLEQEMRHLFPVTGLALHSARVTNADRVGVETLAAMAETLTPAAAQLPAAPDYDVIGYGCTSATAVLGSDRVAALIRAGRHTRAVTTPLDALVAACGALGLRRIAVLTPYVPEVNAGVLAALQARGVEAPAAHGLGIPEEAAVARLAPAQILAPARALVEGAAVDGLFLSCTNLPTRAVVPVLEAETGLPVLSSNLVLAWHMARLAGVSLADCWSRSLAVCGAPAAPVPPG